MKKGFRNNHDRYTFNNKHQKSIDYKNETFNVTSTNFFSNKKTIEDDNDDLNKSYDLINLKKNKEKKPTNNLMNKYTKRDSNKKTKESLQTKTH